MAQAARQSLRMQKELKLLITDPPHGASFPSLSDDSSSITSIDANFKGPEGTVYENGVFKIKIQIPDRYPFQPPMVTFATPIYHPNIDTGGRICLDILNLPPKGSWQPSLNISTVLTSIGLLLSEPNPDDGLMDDASREYKYNRQAFDQKARSMTDKYARAGESSSSIGSHDSQTHVCPSTSKAESEGPDASKCVIGSSRKLSLGSSSKQDCSKEKNKLTNDTYSNCSLKSAQHEEAKPIVTEFNRNHNKQEASKHKLSLRVPVVSGVANCESTRTNMPSHCSSISTNRNPSKEASDSLCLVQADPINGHVTYKDEDSTGRNRSCISLNEGTRSLESVKTSQGSRHSEKLHPALSILPDEVITSHMKTKSHKDVSDRSQSGSNSTDERVKTEVAVGLKTSFGPTRKPALLANGKENLGPSQPSRLKLSRQTISENGSGRKKQPLTEAQKPSDEIMGSKSDHMQLHLENPPNFPVKVINVMNNAQLDVKQQSHKTHGEESISESKQHPAVSPKPEETIVLDSEDSEDENVPARLRLSLARKRLAMKRRRIT